MEEAVLRVVGAVLALMLVAVLVELRRVKRELAGRVEDEKFLEDELDESAKKIVEMANEMKR